MSQRLLRITGKLLQLGTKVVLVRCFGIDGAACLLASVAAAQDQSRAAVGTAIKAGTAAVRAVRSVIARARQHFREKQNNPAGNGA